MANLFILVDKEFRKVLARAGLSGKDHRAVLTHLAILAAFGALVPWRKGIDFLDPVFIAAYGFLGVFFTAPASVAPREGSASFMQESARGVACALYGWGVGLLIEGVALLTVNLTSGYGSPLFPRIDLLVAVLAAGLTVCLLVAVLGTVVSRRTSPQGGRLLLRLVFLVVLALLYWATSAAPDNFRRGLMRQMTSAGLTRITGAIAIGSGLIFAVLLLALRGAYTERSDSA